MNILYLEHYAGSPEMGMEFRPYYLSREWVKMGHNVTIIAGDFSHLRKKNPVVNSDFQKEQIDGIDYVWLKTGEYRGNGLKRAISMGAFVGKLLLHAGKIAKEVCPDVVIASSTYPLDTYPAQRIAKIANAKYVHEVHDLWPATLYEIGGMSKHHPFVVLMQMAEDSAYKHCDKCVSLTPYSRDYMVEHGLAAEKFINIQNGVALEDWDNYECIPKQHADFFELHKNDFIVGYFGGFALSNALDKVLDVAKELANKKQDVIIVLVGDGAEKSRLMNRADQERIDNLFFLPPVNKKAIPDLLSYFDCSYMTGLNSPLYRFGLCLNKMYDSMMAGVPIICAFDAPKTLVSIYECGIQCNPNSHRDVADSIISIKLLSMEERKKMGNRGKEAIINEYNYKYLAKKFLERIVG